MTIACGLSHSFGVLFVARMGVGFGEAALTPTSHAIIASTFPPGKVARAMSVFQLGAFFGLGAALLLGGGDRRLARQRRRSQPSCRGNSGCLAIRPRAGWPVDARLGDPIAVDCRPAATACR